MCFLLSMTPLQIAVVGLIATFFIGLIGIFLNLRRKGIVPIPKHSISEIATIPAVSGLLLAGWTVLVLLCFTGDKSSNFYRFQFFQEAFIVIGVPAGVYGAIIGLLAHTGLYLLKGSRQRSYIRAIIGVLIVILSSALWILGWALSSIAIVLSATG